MSALDAERRALSEQLTTVQGERGGLITSLDLKLAEIQVRGGGAIGIMSCIHHASAVSSDVALPTVCDIRYVRDWRCFPPCCPFSLSHVSLPVRHFMLQTSKSNDVTLSSSTPTSQTLQQEVAHLRAANAELAGRLQTVQVGVPANSWACMHSAARGKPMASLCTAKCP